MVDTSAPDIERRLASVREILDKIDLGQIPELLVFNQIDKLPPGVGESIAARHGGVAVSALKHQGFGELLTRAEDLLREDGHGNDDPMRRRPRMAEAQGGRE